METEVSIELFLLADCGHRIILYFSWRCSNKSITSSHQEVYDIIQNNHLIQGQNSDTQRQICSIYRYSFKKGFT